MGLDPIIPADAAVCGVLAVLFALLAFALRNRLAASTPAAALFLVLLTLPALTGIASLYRPAEDQGFLQAVAVEAYAMMLGLMPPVAVLLIVMERSRRRWEVRRCIEAIEDLRGWKSPAATRQLQGLIRRLSRMGVTDLDLTRCHLCRSNLNGKGLAGARLVGADLEGANLSGSDMKKADLQGADLRRAVLRRADLAGAILWGADLREAILAEAELTGALLKEADLSGADLGGAQMEGTKGLTLVQLSRVRSLHKAKLPPALLSKVKERYPALLRAGGAS